MKAIKEFLAECWEDKQMGVAVYLCVCGGAANIVAAFFAIRWLVEHVRIV